MLPVNSLLPICRRERNYGGILFSKALKATLNGTDVFSALFEFFAGNDISWDKVVGFVQMECHSCLGLDLDLLNWQNKRIQQ